MCIRPKCSPNIRSDTLAQNTSTYTSNGELLTLQESMGECSRMLLSDPSVTGSKRRLVLASSSPRRHELIKALDLRIRIQVPVSTEGPPLHHETPEKYTLRLALAKAREIAPQNPDSIILGADTIVMLGNEIIGKPTNKHEAIRMLSRLRGRKHKVVTSIVVVDGASGDWSSATKITEVTLRKYSNTEMSHYVKSGSPLDKAGSYAIQDRMFNPAENVVGCYLNVIGLPICEAFILLKRAGMSINFRPKWIPPKECLDCELSIHQEPDKT